MNEGKWEYREDAIAWRTGGWICSVCKARNANIGGPEHSDPMLYIGSKYCPNCGDKKKGKALPTQVNKEAMKRLSTYRFRLTRQQFKTLRGQILAGEDKAAMKGLWKIIRKEGRLTP